MLVFKFGGASVMSAPAVKNLADIVSNFSERLVIVVSAMGKTTNALEEICSAYFNGYNEWKPRFNELKDYHFQIMEGLFPIGYVAFDRTMCFFSELESELSKNKTEDFDFEYDRIICWGELLSTLIVSEYLQYAGIENQWLDARKILITDNTHRDAKVLVEVSQQQADKLIDFSRSKIFVTQGFIGSSIEGEVCTLGREGSDYSASMFAFLCNAQKVVIWKDVDGVFNADPKFFLNPIKLSSITYSEAIELAYFGAKVIHPKTIKPLQNKSIPLYVRSFLHPENEGTIISDEAGTASEVPFFIFKQNQILLSISPKDFSFIVEENLSLIFGLLARFHIKLNLMQNSAISFSICFDYDERRTHLLMNELKHDFRLLYNTGLELITIRNYTETTIAQVTTNRKMMVEQKSRNTARFVVS